MARLARIYSQQGRSKKAKEIQLKVLELQKEVLGKGHSKTIQSIVELAVTYYQQDRLEEAEGLMLLIANTDISEYIFFLEYYN